MRDPGRGRWYLDASWSAPKAALPTPVELAATGARLLAVDLNAGHLAVCVVDVHGNPVGIPVSVPTDLTGPASRRDGRLRSAISTLIGLARDHGCAGHAGLVVVAVDPAYTSRWGGQYWKAPLQQQSKTTVVTGHHAAAAAIGRRALGHGIRRRQGVTAHDRRIVRRRATGQTASRPRARGTAGPPRTTGMPVEGGRPAGTGAIARC
ncbi:hypothetical protein [Streptomyces sp. WAC07061]|uniref:hypothetical protein n=1 Tax=Streptomyces sp. WAC07061 TaxID=2487410 RepID=UPI0021AEE01F|nr:hypothetical protein [Streptomyces sp. WAC07061]